MPNGRALWEIGSITKTITSLLLAAQVSDGQLALDQPVQTLLPSERVSMPTRDGKFITLVQLSVAKLRALCEELHLITPRFARVWRWLGTGAALDAN